MIGVNMNHSRWFKKFSWTMALASCFMMVTSPLAMAKEAQNQKSEMLRSVLKQTGLNSAEGITYLEFWNKVKDNFSPALQAKLYPAVLASKNEKLPKLEVSEVKGAKGELIPRISMNMDGQTFSFEYPMDGKTIAKVNGVVISADSLADLENSGLQVKLGKKAEKSADTLKRNQLAKTITPTFAQWSKMTPYQRAYFLSRVRLVTESALDVLAFKKAKKTSSYEFNKYEYLFSVLFGPEAHAGPGKGRVNDTSFASGKACIVAGYPTGKIGISSGSPYCTLNGSDGKLDAKYTANCSAGQVRCNPAFYGYERKNGASLCAPYSLGSAQSATASHRGGTCETGSPLSGKPEETIGFVQSMLSRENNVNPTELDKLIFMKDGKATVTKETYDKYLDPMLNKFNEQKNLAESVCSEIDKNPSAFQRQGSNSQTEACSALRARIVSVRTVLEDIVIDGQGEVATKDCDPSTPGYIEGGLVGASGRCECSDLNRPYEVTGRDGKKVCSDSNVEGCVNPVVDESGRSSCQDEARREAVQQETEKPVKKKSAFWGNFFKYLLIGTGVGLAVNCIFKIGIFGICKDKKHPRSKYVPPYVPPGTATPVDPSTPSTQPADPNTPIESETPSGAPESPVGGASGGGIR
jgi:hypothetical protein